MLINNQWFVDREEVNAADGRQSWHAIASARLRAPTLRPRRPCPLVREIEAKCHVTPVCLLPLVHHSEVDDDVIQSQGDLHQLTDDVVRVPLPARPAQTFTNLKTNINT